MSYNDEKLNSKRLHSILYGAPCEEAELRQLLDLHAVCFPLMLTVLEEQEFKPVEGAWCFRPADELVYITAPAGAVYRRPEWDWLSARDCLEWVGAMQRAILRLRQRRGGHFGNAELAAGNEQRIRQLALRQIYLTLPEWRDAVGCWCDAVFALTKIRIHDSQRLLVGFATEAARPLGSLNHGAHRFHFLLQQILTSYTWRTLHSLLLRALDVVMEQQAEQSARVDPRIRRGLRYIQDHSDAPLTLENVADVVQMAPATLSRKFKKVTGNSFTGYLQERRLERSVNLLLHSERTVLDIALESGFGSVEQYHRVFKQAFATTPNRFRHYQNRVSHFEDLGTGSTKVRNRTSDGLDLS